MGVLSSPLTIAVLMGTILILIVRPRHVNEGFAATLGALAVLALGSATPSDVLRGTEQTAGILVFLLSMMVVVVIAEDAGFFEWSASAAIGLSKGSGHLLYLNLYLLGALVTIFLSLDVTAIIIAPIVCALVRRARLAPLPFVMGCAYVANTASLFLPVSNLTNMLVYSLLHVPFWAFVRWMTIPNLVAMAVNLAVFFVVFRRSIPLRFILPDDNCDFKIDRTRLAIAGFGLGAVVVGLLVFGALGLALYVPALVGALLMTLFALARGDITAERLIGGVAWSLPLFVIGMYTIVVAAERAGMGALWGGVMNAPVGSASFGELVGIAMATTVGSNLVNNIPMSLVVIAGLGSSNSVAPSLTALVSLIGTNVGPNVTIFGSLATMLVLHAARRNGYWIDPWQYLRIGLLTVPLMVLAATLGFWAQLR